MVDVGGGPPRRLTGGDDYSPRWSPDGSAIAFNRFRDGQRAPDLYAVAADGTRLRRLARRANAPAWSRGGVSELAWSPDGSALAYSVYHGRSGWDIQLLETDGGLHRRLTSGRGDEYGPVWSPEGDRIAFERSPFGGGRDNTGTFDVYVMNADGTGRRRLTRCRCTMGGGISWRPAG